MSQDSSPSILDKFRVLSSMKAIPFQASLELTNRCNERCTHCYLETFEDDSKRILSKEDWFKVITELRGAGTLYLILMGGEAMLSPHFWDIAEFAHKLQFHVSMISNGLKINSAEVAQRLKSVGMNTITFSLYSLNPLIHDKMTQVKGSQQKTIQAIEFARAAGIEVTINTLLTEANAEGVFDLYDWAESRNLDMKVDPNITPKLNGDTSPTKFRASRETLLWFYRARSKRWPLGTPRPSLEVMDSHVCNAGKGKCAVNAYGELLPCIEIRESMGSLVKNSFAELWHKPVVEKWRNMKVKDLKGFESLYFQNFCDHCPGAAKNETGKHDELTSFTKIIASVKMQVAEEQKNQNEQQSIEASSIN